MLKVAMFLMALALSTAAHAVDLHQFWDQRCSECHGHAAQFARETLSVVDGKLVGKHHQDDLAAFLRQHRMGPDEADAIGAMLTAQVTTPPIFAEKCASCHGTAAAFVRASVDVVDGELVGKVTAKPVAVFLQRHGKLSAADQKIMVETLARVWREVGGVAPPAK